MQRLLLRILASLPLPLLHGMAFVVGELLYRLQSRQRYYADTNLALCFPELSEEERRRLSRQSVIETSKFLFESPKLWLGRASGINRLMREVTGESFLKKGLASGKGVILICPHLGNWEMIGLYISQHYPMTNMYRPQRNKEFDAIIRQGRERFGARLVPATNQGLRELLKTLKNGEIIGTLPDQNPGSGTGVFVPFFGVMAYTPVFAARLAARTGATVLNAYALRLPHGRGFHLHITPASDCLHSDDIEEAATCMNRDIERLIKLTPQQYWWGYNRFRNRPPGKPAIYTR